MAPARGPGNSHPGVRKVYRGSRKRLRRIKWWPIASTEFWIFVVLMLAMLLVGVPWLIKHPPVDLHRHLANE